MPDEISVVTALQPHKYSAGAKTKGYIKNKTTGEIKNFLFNPSEIEFERSATYGEIAAPGLSYPMTQYVRGNILNFSIPLYIYDRPFSGLVQEWEDFLNKFVPPTTNVGGYVRPDEMLFVMGNVIRDCVCESLNTKYTNFTSELLPNEAEFTLKLRQV